MSVGYVTVQWNRHKRVYDGLIVAGVSLYLVVFVVLGKVLLRPPHALSDEILALRALGSCAYLMLHVVLCIGPATRLFPRLAPLLYNRRHLGVATFLVGLAHGTLALGYYHGFGAVHPLVSLLSGVANLGSLRAFPFQLLGFFALLILFLMAATSHDFWNRNLTPRVWKGLHMLVYGAYGLLVAHVALGALQTPRSFAYVAVVGAGAALVTGLHLFAGLREARREDGASLAEWIDIGFVGEIPESRARVVCPRGAERIAVFRHAGGLSAITNLCAHQGGPLGEGRIIDGCVTCPWHGWQYRPEDGRSPPPFTEKIATYRVRVQNGRVLLNPEPMAPGTPVPPGSVAEPSDGG